MNQLYENYKTLKNLVVKQSNLLAVSKNHPPQLIEEVYSFGQRDFGENKVQELIEKSSELSHLDEIKWHFIGSLQKNKINKLLEVKHLVAIHSVDSIELLEKILSKKISNKIGLFLQVNTSNEAEKSGFEDISMLNTATELILKNPSFILQGLMTIGKIRTDNFQEDAEKSFSSLVDIKNILDQKYDLDLELSMGMSQDFEIAMRYNSSWVRLGSSLFGERL